MEAMAQAVRDRAADGIGVARPTSAELGWCLSKTRTSAQISDLPRSLIEGKASSAPDTKIDEPDLPTALLASTVQMRQAGTTTIGEAKGNVN